MAKMIIKEKISAVVIKKKTAALLTSVVCAVLLPQLVHLCGMLSGAGKALGEIFLPMHLPVMLAGALGGPAVGMISGLLSPIVSFALTGMPAGAVLPFMCIELMSYGLIAGLLARVKLPALSKILLVQIGGRAVRVCAMLVSFYALGNANADAVSFISSIGTGAVGIAIQLCVFTLVTYFVDKRGER